MKPRPGATYLQPIRICKNATFKFPFPILPGFSSGPALKVPWVKGPQCSIHKPCLPLPHMLTGEMEGLQDQMGKCPEISPKSYTVHPENQKYSFLHVESLKMLPNIAWVYCLGSLPAVGPPSPELPPSTLDDHLLSP